MELHAAVTTSLNVDCWQETPPSVVAEKRYCSFGNGFRMRNVVLLTWFVCLAVFGGFLRCCCWCSTDSIGKFFPLSIGTMLSETSAPARPGASGSGLLLFFSCYC